MQISKWFLGTKYLITLLIIITLIWITIFAWFAIEEKKYGDDVVDQSSFMRTFHEFDDNGIIKKKYNANAFTDSIYYTSTMFGTFGYGDIYPKSNSAKGLITFWHFIIIIFIMNLYEHYFVSNKTIKDLSLDMIKLSETLNSKCDGYNLFVEQT